HAGLRILDMRGAAALRPFRARRDPPSGAKRGRKPGRALRLFRAVAEGELITPFPAVEAAVINLSILQHVADLKPRITVIGVGGAGGNAVNNMVRANLVGCEFVACNTDSQAIKNSLAGRKIQLGQTVTRGLGAGSRPDVGRAAAEEAMDEILEAL